ncbi:hypothetical protein [Mycobacterium kubicae]|uniref:hypothetical protein n=1 Tax=Mycobacterium kubicae TaxID=120959 RepID=UPI001041BF02|nr:hypothetical protein [Mycobacterium kubicae]
MTQPDELTALRAAVEICDETNGGADDKGIAARIGAEVEVVRMKLLPRIAKYFETAMPGDDGIGAVHGPTEAARQFVGPRPESG